MKFKYCDIKDYFINKHDLRTYKNWDGRTTLFFGKEVQLSNSNKDSVLNLNIDKFRNSTIVFQNSSFKNIVIREYNRCNNVKVQFIGCKIDEANMGLCGNSDILLSMSIVNSLKINDARNVNLRDSKNISNQPIKLTCSAKNINIENSNVILNVDNSNILKVNRGNIFVQDISTNSNVDVANTAINGMPDKSVVGLIKSDTINIHSNALINNCIIEAQNMNISDAILFSKNCIFEIYSTLNVAKHSYFGDDHFNNSELKVENVCIDYDSGIDVCGLTEEVGFGESINIEYNKLKHERQKLVKTLSLVKNKIKKCNRSW